MSTPGTPDWLREQADRFMRETIFPADLAEGLKRAALRIERLQGELSKVKTGVDQTSKPIVTQPFTVTSVCLPENDALYERVFEWVVDSGDYLDPAIILVDGPMKDLRINNLRWAKIVGLELQGRHFDRVRIQKSENDFIDLAGCQAIEIGSDKKGEDRLNLSGRRV